MNWKEFFKMRYDDLFEGRPLTQLYMKDGTVVQGRLIDADPFIIVEGDKRAYNPNPTGRVVVVRSDEISSIRLIVPNLVPDTWTGFDEVGKGA